MVGLYYFFKILGLLIVGIVAALGMALIAAVMLAGFVIGAAKVAVGWAYYEIEGRLR